MKQSLLKAALLFIFSHALYAQQLSSVLTKIERSTNVTELNTFYDPSLAPFYHGVASGDPLEDAVMIWTRVTTNANKADVRWKVALDPAMQQVVQQGIVTTDQNKDYTVKVDVTGLQAYQTYYYQFQSGNAFSLVGKTKTAPARQEMVENLRFAIASCSNYQNGYFNAYNQIAQRTDLDAVIHLGDYIYEYESEGYGYSDAVGRGHVPTNEIITLNDYRVRHSFYKLDPMLRNAHQNHPFITIWDDHEFANDANKFGAENHTDATEGSWEARKNNAYKAYFEWMPIRANSIEEYRLYRTISYGKLMDLILLDTRIQGRDTQVNSSKNLISAAASNHVFKTYVQEVIATKDLSKEDELKSVLHEVLPMMLNIADKQTKAVDSNTLSPTEFTQVVDEFAGVILAKNKTKNATDTTTLERLLRKGTKYPVATTTKSNKRTYKSILGAEQFAWLTNQLRASTAKWRIIGNQVMLMPWNGVPTNDAWDGYQEEREKLLQFVKNQNINNIVVLTGDIHSTFVGEVRYDGKCEMCEFVVPSVTSTNLDFAGGVVSGISEFYIRLLNRHIKDVDLNNHGYYVLDVRKDKVQGDWYDVADITRPVAGERRSRSWFVRDNNCRVRETSTAAVALSKATKPVAVAPIEVATASVAEEDFLIIGVYPNPMYDQGNLHYILTKDTKITVRLYDMNGKMQYELLDSKATKGIYNLSFDVSVLPKGTYIMVVASETTKAQRKISIQ